MAKVLCKLPNASTNINGVRFVTHRDGMISEEIDDAVALAFAEIPGYFIHDPKAAEGQGQQSNQQPPAGSPAGAPSSPSAGSATPPAGGTSPAAPPAGAQAPTGGAPDPNF